MRKQNTDRQGCNWTPQQIVAVWQKGRIIPNYAPEKWRWDKCGKPIRFSDHGNRDSEFGWEIDHINPVANGGTDVLYNLEPLYWGNNASKGDSLKWTCPVPVR